jgi:hypothetical protein
LEIAEEDYFEDGKDELGLSQYLHFDCLISYQQYTSVALVAHAWVLIKWGSCWIIDNHLEVAMLQNIPTH